MTDIPKLLPLGSAVAIEDDETTYVIIARGFQKQAEGYLAGYKAVPYPQGAATGAREIVIRGTQITKVLHRGHETAKDVTFAAEQLEHAKAPPKKPVAPAPEPDLTVDLAAPASVPASAPATATPEADKTDAPAPGCRTPKIRSSSYVAKESRDDRRTD